MIPTPPAQQEYIITEEQLQSFQRMGSFSNSFFQFVPMLADEIRSRPHTSTPEMCKHWVSSANLKSDFRDQDIGMCYCNKSMYEHDTAIRTEERNKILRLVESDEWQKEHDEQTRNQTLDGIIKAINEDIEYEDYCIKAFDTQINRTQKAILSQVVEKIQSLRKEYP